MHKTHTAKFSPNPSLIPKTRKKALEQWEQSIEDLSILYRSPLVEHWSLLLKHPVQPYKNPTEIWHRMLRLPMSKNETDTTKVFFRIKEGIGIRSIDNSPTQGFNEKEFCASLIYPFNKLESFWQQLPDEKTPKKDAVDRSANRRHSLPSEFPSFAPWRNTTPPDADLYTVYTPPSPHAPASDVQPGPPAISWQTVSAPPLYTICPPPIKPIKFPVPILQSSPPPAPTTPVPIPISAVKPLVSHPRKPEKNPSPPLRTKKKRTNYMETTLHNLAVACQTEDWEGSVKFHCCLFPLAGKSSKLLPKNSLIPDTAGDILKLAEKLISFQSNGTYILSYGTRRDSDEFQQKMIKLHTNLEKKCFPTTARTEDTANKYKALFKLINEPIQHIYQQRCAQLEELARFCQNTNWHVTKRAKITWLPQIPGKNSKGLHVQVIIPDTVNDILQLASQYAGLKGVNDFSGVRKPGNLDFEIKMQALEQTLIYKFLDKSRDTETSNAYGKMYNFLVKGNSLSATSQLHRRASC